jgi:dockerin type I repeat protein/PEP-CTERM motif-containing protein
MKMLLAFGGAVGLLASQSIAANPTIVVGNHVLIPLPNQSFTISVSGGNAVSGVDFNAEVANGGPSLGGTLGPSITGINLVSGTIFASNNSGQQNSSSLPSQAYSGLVITNSGTVNASGTLATMTFDPSNYIGGIYSLKLGGFSNGSVSGDTDFTVAPDFSPIPATITNGNIIVTFPGDTNLDGVVNSADGITLARNYGMQSGATWAMGDFNGDGKINAADATLLKQYWNRSVNINPGVPAFQPGAASAVPEPASLGVVGIGMAAVCLRRRRSL